MRYHKKTYENVFSEDRNPSSKCKLRLENISAYGLELNEYILLFKSFLKDFYSDLFYNCVKLSWLRRRFIFCGKKTTLPMYRNSIPLNNSFVKFVRRNIGHDLQIINKSNFFNRIETYFDDFFPDFEENNPFENRDNYKFPYKNITMEFLIVVYQMDDRIGLLDVADKKNMSFAEFLDYVINHAYCENDFLGRDRYEISHNVSKKYSYYIKDTDKKLRSIKGKKRP